MNGGEGTAPATQNNLWSNKNKVEAPQSVSRDGYLFTGWYTEPQCINEWDFQDTFTDSMTLYAGWKKITNSVSVQSVGNGSAWANVTQAGKGDTVNLTAVPGIGSVFKEWYDRNGNITISDNQFTMPSAPVYVEARFEDIEYNVTLTSTNGGTVSAREMVSANGTAHYNQKVCIDVSPDNGWYLKEWQVISGDVEVYPFSRYYEFKMPAKDVELCAVFDKVVNSIEIDTCGHGVANADKVTAAEGENITLDAIPESGWRFKEWLVKFGDVEIENNTFVMKGNAVAISAIFEQITYPLTVSYTEGGTAQAYVSAAAAGDPIIMKVSPDNGCRFKEWQIIKGNVTVTDNAFIMPAEETEVKAVFEKIPHVITVISDGNGTVSANMSTACVGDLVALNYQANSNYRLKGWQTIDGNVTIENDQFTMPAEEVAIKAIFEKIPHTLTVTYTEGGIAYTPKEIYTAGETVPLQCWPDIGYTLKEYQVLAGNINIDGSFIMPAEDVSVNVVFERLPHYDITVTNDGNGTAEADVTSSFESRFIYLYTTPNKGYRFKEWEVLSGSNVTIESDGFEMPGENVEIKAIFEPVYPILTDSNVNVYRWSGLSEDMVHEAAEGDVLNVEIYEGAQPYHEHYFTGEILVDGVSLGSASAQGATWYVKEFVMPAHQVTVSAAQESTEEWMGYLGDGDKLELPEKVYLQLNYAVDMIYEDEDHSLIDLDNSGTPDVSIEINNITEGEDIIAVRYYAQLLPNADASGVYPYYFTDDNTYKYTMISFSTFVVSPYFVSVNNSDHGTITVDKALADSGDSVSVTIVPHQGYKLKTFSVKDANDNEVTVSDNKFIMPAGDVTVSAEYEMMPAVIIKSVDINGITFSQTVYTETYTDTDYTVQSVVYLDGYNFNGWKVNDTLYKTAEEVKTAVESLVREGTAVTVVTDYQKKTEQYSVTVNNGTLADGNTQDIVQVSTLIKVTANEPESGKKFSHWTRDGITVSYNTAYSFFMPSADVALEAVYAEDQTQVQEVGTAIIESVKPDISAGKVSFVAVVNVPANCTMVMGGLVATSDASIGENVNDQQYDFLKLSTKTTANTKNLKYTWTKSKVTAETIWYVRAYLVYKDANGSRHTVYSDAVKANIL